MWLYVTIFELKQISIKTTLITLSLYVCWELERGYRLKKKEKQKLFSSLKNGYRPLGGSNDP